MKKRMLALIVGIALAVVAVFIIHAQIEERERMIRMLAQRARQTGRTANVVVAVRNISRGSTISDNAVGLAQVPAEAVGPGSIEALGYVIGKKAAVNIQEHQPIYSTMVTTDDPDEPGELRLSEKISGNRRAFTVSIDNISAVGGQVTPGDRVDIIGNMRMPVLTADGRQANEQAIVTLLENVRVLDTGGARGGTNNITFSLAPYEINILSYALEMGQIKLSLRSPTHITKDDIAMQPFTMTNFLQDIYRRQHAHLPKPIEAEKEKEETTVTEKSGPVKPITIYRRGQKSSP